MNTMVFKKIDQNTACVRGSLIFIPNSAWGLRNDSPNGPSSKVSVLRIKSPPKLGKNDEYAQIINPVEIP